MITRMITLCGCMGNFYFANLLMFSWEVVVLKINNYKIKKCGKNSSKDFIKYLILWSSPKKLEALKIHINYRIFYEQNKYNFKFLGGKTNEMFKSKWEKRQIYS